MSVSLGRKSKCHVCADPRRTVTGRTSAFWEQGKGHSDICIPAYLGKAALGKDFGSPGTQCFIYDKLHEIFTFSTDQIRVNRNGGRCKLQHGNQQPKGCCLEEMPMSPRCPCDEPLHGSWTRWDLVSRKQGSPSVLRFLLEQFYSQQN